MWIVSTQTKINSLDGEKIEIFHVKKNAERQAKENYIDLVHSYIECNKILYFNERSKKWLIAKKQKADIIARRKRYDEWPQNTIILEEDKVKLFKEFNFQEIQDLFEENVIDKYDKLKPSKIFKVRCYEVKPKDYADDTDTDSDDSDDEYHIDPENNKILNCF